MSQSTQSGRRDAHRLNRDEAEVREALLEHSDEKYDGWIFAQLDAVDGRMRIE